MYTAESEGKMESGVTVTLSLMAQRQFTYARKSFSWSCGPIGCHFSLLCLCVLSLCAQTLHTPDSEVSPSNGDMLAVLKGQERFSFRKALEPAYRAYAREAWDKASNCCYEHAFEVISMAGSLISLRDRFYAGCPNAAHPTNASRLATLDLAAPGGLGYGANAEDAMLLDAGVNKLVSLANLYGEAVLLQAFRADPFLKPYLQKPISSLDQLNAAIPEQGMKIKNNPCRFRLSTDYLTRFAFHHVESEKVAVRISLEPIGGACSSATSELGLLLDWPAKIPQSARVLVTPKPPQKIQAKISFCTGK